MLMPFLIGILPLIGLGVLADHGAELIFVGFSIVLAGLSMCWGYRTHGRLLVFLTFACSAALIATGYFVVSDLHHIPFVVLGAFGISLSHFINRKLCLSCAVCNAHEQELVAVTEASAKKSSCCSHCS